MLLAQVDDVRVEAEAANYGELMRVLRAHPCDVLLIDVEMPGRDGIEALSQLKKTYPRLAALVLSAHPEERFAVRAMRAGALGYLNKTAALDTLVGAVRRAAGGGRYLSPEVSEALAAAVTADPSETPHEALSQREFQVFRLIAQGRRLSQIGEALSLSPKTVSVYRARVLEKLGLRTNVDVARYAISRGLVDSGERGA